MRTQSKLAGEEEQTEHGKKKCKVQLQHIRSRDTPTKRSLWWQLFCLMICAMLELYGGYTYWTRNYLYVYEQDAYLHSSPMLLTKHGDGIVFTGNARQMKLIRVSIHALQEANSSYSVEIFVSDALDLDACLQVFHDERLRFPFHVDCKLLSMRDPNMYETTYLERVYFLRNRIHEFALKPLALLQSSFQNVLFIDSGNVLFRNPDILFRSDEYKTNGAIFWPDLYGSDCETVLSNTRELWYVYGPSTRQSAVWKLAGIDYIDNDLRYNQSMESGQIMIDTTRHHDELLMILRCANDYSYQWHMQGDKDCFRLMFLSQQKPFYFMPFQAAQVGFVDIADSLFHTVGIAQYWTDGRILFVHRITKFAAEPNPWSYVVRMNTNWKCPFHSLYTNELQRTIWPVNISQDFYTVQPTELAISSLYHRCAEVYASL